MRFQRHILFFICLIAFASCAKNNSSNDNATLTVIGRLEPKGTTPYNYGTNTIIVNASTAYLVESTGLTLASFNGDSVQVTMKDMGIRVNPGPELYNVLTITPL